MISDNNHRKVNTTVVTYLWCITLVAILLLFLNTYLSSKLELQSQRNPNDNQQNLQPLKPSNLGLTTDEFRESFNQIARKNNMDLQIKSLTIQKGLVQDTFNYMLTDDIVLIGNVDSPDNALQKITVLSTGSDPAGSLQNIRSAIDIVIYAVNPNLHTADQAQLRKDIGLSNSQFSGDVELIHNEKRFYYRHSDKLGTMFIISSL